MEIAVEHVDHLRFADGAPVRAASAVAALGDGFLVVQDDATHAAWVRDGAVAPLRVLPAIGGLDSFDSASGTKHLKPDLEAALTVSVESGSGVLLLGSGSSPARMRWSLLREGGPDSPAQVVEMTGLYAVVAERLEVEPTSLNMEGACILGDSLRWYHRGLPSAGIPTGSVDLALAPTLAAVLGHGEPHQVPVTNPQAYDLGAVEGVGLAITDAVTLPGGSVLVSAAAEDSPNPRDDGPVAGSALALLRGEHVESVAALPRVEGAVAKVEGLMLLEADAHGARLLAVADSDDPQSPSFAMSLRVRF